MPTLTPYLFYPGNCEQAVEYYKNTLGAEVDCLMRYKESPEQPPEGVLPDNYGDKVMHASIRIAGRPLMVSDACNDATPLGGFSLSINVATVEEAEHYFGALAKEGKVIMPLEKTFWAERFGMVEDPYGVSWMVNADPASEQA